MQDLWVLCLSAGRPWTKRLYAPLSKKRRAILKETGDELVKKKVNKFGKLTVTLEQHFIVSACYLSLAVES